MPPTPSDSARLAAIDIGTNTVKLLIADVTATTITPILQQSRQTRLGRGLSATGRLSDASVDATLSVLADYQRLCQEHETLHIVASATSAARDAENGAEFTDKIQQLCGWRPEVITGQEEASLIYAGIADPPLGDTGSCTLLDVGGGSTETIVVTGGKVRFQQSYNVGSVHLFEKAELTDPLCQEQLARVNHQLQSAYHSLGADLNGQRDPTNDRLILAGGGAVAAIMVLRGLEKFDAQAIESEPIRLDEASTLRQRLWTSTLAHRLTWTGMPQDRADILPIGVAIAVHLMEALSAQQLWVSTRGLRFGLVRRLYDQTQGR